MGFDLAPSLNPFPKSKSFSLGCSARFIAEEAAVAAAGALTDVSRREDLSYGTGAKNAYSKTNGRGHSCSADAGRARWEARITLPSLRRHVDLGKGARETISIPGHEVLNVPGFFANEMGPLASSRLHRRTFVHCRGGTCKNSWISQPSRRAGNHFGCLPSGLVPRD